MTRSLGAVLVCASAWAHGGGVDSSGCHLDRASGVRHCHPERTAPPEHEAEVAVPAAPVGASRRRVVRTIDGDTVVLDGDERVRLIGVNTPEMKDDRAAVRFLAKRAAVFLDELVLRKPVRLEHDRDRTDRFGRLLTYLYLDDGRCVNAEIVKQGYGFAFTKYPFKYMSYFRRLEQTAREENRGLWADGLRILWRSEP